MPLNITKSVNNSNEHIQVLINFNCISVDLKTYPNTIKNIRLHSDLHAYLLINTQWLPANTTLAERVYCLKYGIVVMPLCVVCGCPAPYHQGHYRTYCSHNCMYKSTSKYDKAKATMFNNTGVDHNWKRLLSGGLRSCEKTNILRYGNAVPFLCISIQYKIKQTNIARYGVEYPFQSDMIQLKAQQTNLIKYGVKYTLASPDIQDKIKHNNLIKYGVKNHNQYHLLVNGALSKLTDYDWMYNQYIDLNKSSSYIGEGIYAGGNTVIRYLKQHKIDIRVVSNHSQVCIRWIEDIMLVENIFIQHACNIGEYKIPNTRYKVDGYCISTNTVYEFHGDVFHGNPSIFAPHIKCSPFSELTAGELYQKTIDREQNIKALGYNLVVIWESDYNIISSQLKENKNE